MDETLKNRLYKPKSLDGKVYKRMCAQEAKADKGKLRISLVPTQIIKDIAQIRMYGTDKYGSSENWRRVEVERYIDAMLRHLLEFLKDWYSKDEESGIEHYKHAECNMAFISELLEEKKNGTS